MRSFFLSLGGILAVGITAVALSGCHDEEDEKRVSLPKGDPLLQAIEQRLGKPDRVTGSGISSLHYDLPNGDTLTLTVIGSTVHPSYRLNLRSRVGKRIALKGRLRAPAKPLYPLVLETEHGPVYVPRKDVEEGLLNTTAVVEGRLRYEPGRKAPPTVAGLPEHYYFDAEPLFIRRVNQK
jgi:hypothetical protein